MGAIWLERHGWRRVDLLRFGLSEQGGLCLLWLCWRDGAARGHGQRLSPVPLSDCGRQFNERSGGVLNRSSLPSDVAAFVVFCRLRSRLMLRDLSEILILRGIEVSHEAVPDWKPSCCRSWARTCASGGMASDGMASDVALVKVGTWTRRI